MNGIKLLPDEIAKIISRLMCSIASMESSYGKEKNIELAKELFHKCVENGIAIYAYDEEEYLGKTYKTKPNDDMLWTSCHEWTADDPHYENPIYSEYDQLYMKDKRGYNEHKLEMLKSINAYVDGECLIVVVKQTFGEKTYSYRLIYGNGFRIEGPFDRYGCKVETGRSKILFDILKDVFNMFARHIDGMQLNDYAVGIVYAIANEETSKLEQIAEDEQRRSFQERINSLCISQQKDIAYI